MRKQWIPGPFSRSGWGLGTRLALEMMVQDDMEDLDSRGELDIEDDPNSPLPQDSDSDAPLEDESDEESLPRNSSPSDSDEDPHALASILDDSLGGGKQINVVDISVQDYINIFSL